MSVRTHNFQSASDMRPPVDSEIKRTEIDEVAEVKVNFNTRVRNRLEQLLGTDILRLNDRQYMRTLMRRIYEDQESSLQKRTETRQMQENKRLKNLVEDMKMEKPPDMVETAFVVSFKKTKAAMEKVQRRQFNKRHNIKKRKTVSCAELDSDDETSPEVEEISTNEQYHNSSFLGTTLDLSAEEDDSLAEEQRQQELARLAIKFGKYKEPLVQLLMQEGTVPRLYDLAEIILVKPPKPQKKKKAIVEEEQPSQESEPEKSSAEDGTGTEEEEEEEEEPGGEEEDDADEAAADDAGEPPAESQALEGETEGAAPDTSDVGDVETAPEDAGAGGAEAEDAGAAGAETEEGGAAGTETEDGGAAGAETEDVGAAGTETEDGGAASAETETGQSGEEVAPSEGDSAAEEVAAAEQTLGEGEAEEGQEQDEEESAAGEGEGDSGEVPDEDLEGAETTQEEAE